MLSKSQARLFFFVATAGFSGVFLLLTLDSIYRVGKRSNVDAMTEEVVRGKEIWESNNCMGCHTILGEGAYYAPELTKVVERRGPEWLRIFLRDPEAMYPGRRRMVKYDWTDSEIGDVIAFLTWIGNIDTNGFPAKPDLAPKGALVATAAAATPPAGGTGAAAPPPPAIFSTVCIGCHSFGGTGGAVGPALDGVGSRYADASLRAWLLDPQGYKPGTTMPDLNLTDQQLDELVAFLMASK